MATVTYALRMGNRILVNEAASGNETQPDIVATAQGFAVAYEIDNARDIKVAGYAVSGTTTGFSFRSTAIQARFNASTQFALSNPTFQYLPELLRYADGTLGLVSNAEVGTQRSIEYVVIGANGAQSDHRSVEVPYVNGDVLGNPNIVRLAGGSIVTGAHRGEAVDVYVRDSVQPHIPNNPGVAGLSGDGADTDFLALANGNVAIATTEANGDRVMLYERAPGLASVATNTLVTSTTKDFSQVALVQLANGNVAAVMRVQEAGVNSIALAIKPAIGAANVIYNISPNGCVEPEILSLSDGTIFVSWTNQQNAGNTTVEGRLFGIAGNALSGVIDMTPYAGNQGAASIADLGEGRFGLAYVSNEAGRETGGGGTFVEAQASELVRTVIGDSTGEFLSGGIFADVVFGGDGGDTLSGYAGNDRLHGEAGIDTLFGGTGVDYLHGGAGLDVYVYDQGDAQRGEFIDGEAQDRVYARGIVDFRGTEVKAVETLYLGPNTTMTVTPDHISTSGFRIVQFDGAAFQASALRVVSDYVAPDTTIDLRSLTIYGLETGIDRIEIAGNDGLADTIHGSALAETIYGLGGSDTVRGNGGDDTILTGTGNDTIVIGAGNDVVNGGGDLDTLSFADFTTVVTFSLSATGAQAHALGTIRFSEIENLTGGSAGDVLTGNSARNLLRGGGGDDRFVMQADGAGDQIDGQAGGSDTIDFDGASVGVQFSFEDVVNGVPQGDGFYSGGGFGTGFPLGIERAIGGKFNDVFTGRNGADTMEGRLGNDTFTDGGGVDLMLGGGDNDKFILSADEAEDEARGEAGLSDVIDLTNATSGVTVVFTAAGSGNTDFGGIGKNSFSGIEGVYGSGHGDTVTGSDAGDTLYTRGGADIINAGGGADTVNGGNGDDVIRGGAGGDALSGGRGNDKFLIEADGATDTFNGNEDTDILDFAAMTSGVTVTFSADSSGGTASGGGIGADTFTSIEWISGSNSADVMTGGAGAETLVGRNGADVLRGGGGADTLYGQGAADTFRFNTADFASGVRDTVKDFTESAGNVDRLELQGAAASYVITQSGTGVLALHVASGGTILIENFSTAALADQLFFV